tara:strand:- start:6904 stop:7824 length:921 start_codon:yes stop_codon:yes gene_type:complete
MNYNNYNNYQRPYGYRYGTGWKNNTNNRANIINTNHDTFGYENDPSVFHNTTPFLNLDELRKEERSSAKTANQIYKLILAKCHQKIRRTNSTTDSRRCYYDIPSFIPGYPVYNVPYAKNYVIQQLLNNGLYVENIGQSRIYISWHPDDINHYAYQERSDQMVSKPNLYKIGVSPVDERSGSKSKPKIMTKSAEENGVTMLQYDTTIDDLVPVNSKKVDMNQMKYPSDDRSNRHSNRYDNEYNDEGYGRDDLIRLNKYPENIKPKKKKRRKKSRKTEGIEDFAINLNKHRDNYREIDLDDKYIPHNY